MAAAVSVSVSQFSSADNDVMERKIEVEKDERKSQEKIEEYYEIKRSVEFIQRHKFAKVALQFPDHLLPDAPTVYELIKKETNSKLYILGDTSYGSCCVDEVAAEHVGADCIIHYGPACLSPTRRLHTLYVFGREDVCVDKCCDSFKELFPDTTEKVVLLFDTIHHHVIDNISQRLQNLYSSLVISSLHNQEDRRADEGHSEETKNGTESTKEPSNKSETQSNTEESNNNTEKICRSGRVFHLPKGCSLDEYKMFYIGEETATLTNLIMTFNKNQFYSFNPKSNIGRKETLNVNRSLMKRFHLVQKAKEANIFGILVGTLGVADYMSIIDRLKKIIAKSGRKSYTFVVGKLNVPKLANFAEIDIFVLVACAQNTLLDSHEFFKPVITPYEAELACIRSREWTGDCVTDFRELLPGSALYHDENTKGADDDEPEFSLLSGKLLSMKTSEEETGSTSQSLVERNQESSLVAQSPAAAHLSSRSWRGLEQKLGETPVTLALEGRSGIAAGYTHEQETITQT